MSRHRASSMINIYGTNYCADHTNGNIYEYSPDVYTDNGDPIVKQRDTAVIHGGLFGTPGKRINFNSVTFNIVSGYEDMSTAGTGALPSLNVFDVALTNTVTFEVELTATVNFNTEV